MTIRLITAIGIILLSSATLWAELTVSIVATPPTGDRVIASQPLGRKGPTSIRYFAEQSALRRPGQSPNPQDPNAGKYWLHDRDLGQTFTTPPGPQQYKLDAITLRVGVTSSTVGIEGARKAKVSLQLYKVTGTPVINDNGTTGGTQFSKAYILKETMGMADDYITGETYTSLTVARGGILPDPLSAGENNTLKPTTESKGTYWLSEAWWPFSPIFMRIIANDMNRDVCDYYAWSRGTYAFAMPTCSSTPGFIMFL
jgi:hypothetical protein